MAAERVKVHVGLSRPLQERLVAAGAEAVAAFAAADLGLSNVRQDRLARFGILVGELPAAAIARLQARPGVDFVETDQAKEAW